MLKGSAIDNVTIPISGTKPSSGTLKYSNNILTSGCLVIWEYAVTFDGGTVSNIEKNGDCKNIPTIPTCPGCIFAWYSNSKMKWIKGSGYGKMKH